MYSFFNLSIVYIWRCRMRQIGKSSVEQTARKNSQQTVKNAHKSHHTNLLSQQQKLVITFFRKFFQIKPTWTTITEIRSRKGLFFFYLIHPVSTHRSIDHQQPRLSVSDAQSMSCINSLLIWALTTLGPRDNLQSLLARYFRQLIEELT